MSAGIRGRGFTGVLLRWFPPLRLSRIGSKTCLIDIVFRLCRESSFSFFVYTAMNKLIHDEKVSNVWKHRLTIPGLTNFLSNTAEFLSLLKESRERAVGVVIRSSRSSLTLASIRDSTGVPAQKQTWFTFIQVGLRFSRSLLSTIWIGRKHCWKSSRLLFAATVIVFPRDICLTNMRNFVDCIRKVTTFANLSTFIICLSCRVLQRVSATEYHFIVLMIWSKTESKRCDVPLFFRTEKALTSLRRFRYILVVFNLVKQANVRRTKATTIISNRTQTPL